MLCATVRVEFLLWITSPVMRLIRLSREGNFFSEVVDQVSRFHFFLSEDLVRVAVPVKPCYFAKPSY
ncbi:hypothetical protein BH18ACT12_BH18ACT12_11550 [soil metagenome]